MLPGMSPSLAQPARMNMKARRMRATSASGEDALVIAGAPIATGRGVRHGGGDNR